MTKTSFTAQIDAWVAKTERRMEAVLRQSAQDVFNDAQRVGPNHLDPTAGAGGNMPVITGNLRASLTMEINGGEAAQGPDAYVLAVSRLKVGDVLVGAWGGAAAPYARNVHYGSAGRRGRMWAALAAAKWQAIVRKNVALAKRLNP